MRVSCGTGGGEVVLWDPANGELRRQHHSNEHTGRILCMDALPDGRVVTCSEDCTLRVWAVPGENWRCQLLLSGHTQQVVTVAANQDSGIASGSYDRSVRVWNISRASPHASTVLEVACVACLKGHSDDVTAVAWLRDGRILSASADRTIRVWRVAGSFNSCEQTLDSHSLGITGLRVFGDRYGRERAVTMSRDRTLHILT